MVDLAELKALAASGLGAEAERLLQLQQYAVLDIHFVEKSVAQESPTHYVGSIAERVELEPVVVSGPEVVLELVVDESGAESEPEAELEIQGLVAVGVDLRAAVHREVAHTPHSGPIRQQGRA